MLLKSRAFAPVDIAIDLGTSKTAIFLKDEGIVANAPSVLALRHRKSGRDDVIAIGEEARQMIGKEPQSVSVIRPLKSGVVEHFEATKLLLRMLMKEAGLTRWVSRPRVLIGAPCSISDIEKRAVHDAAVSLNARTVHIIEEPLAAAIGADIRIEEPAANLVVDIGSGITEVILISMGGIVISESVRVGGDDFDDELIEYFRRQFKLRIGQQTAEFIKTTHYDVYGEAGRAAIPVKGFCAATRLPRIVEVTPAQIKGVMDKPLAAILETIRKVLETSPPELSGDLVNRHITLAGGGAMLKNLDRLVSETFGIEARVASNSSNTVVLGGGKMLAEISRLVGSKSFPLAR